MKALAAILLLASAALAADSTFEQRKQQTLDFAINYKGPGDMGWGGVAVKLYAHKDLDWCSQKVETLLQGPITGDMFWMFPVVAVAYLDQGQLSDSARQALHRVWKTYMPYRGDTENHFLLYYTCLYLMAQLWPNLPGDAWYSGKTSGENFEEARQWIESWVKLTTTRGQGEYDSPHYMGVYIVPMSYLAAWAKDPAMKKRATMMLEYLMADQAPENLRGIYAGAHARIYEYELVERWLGPATNFDWLWFGEGEMHPDGHLLYYLLSSAYQPPEILRLIATDRSKPYTHYERKRTRNRWRFYDELHGPVYKTTYMRSEYAVSSDQGGVLQPIQQHSWDITWPVPKPQGVHNTFFTAQPYSSNVELETYFVFNADSAVDGVVKSKRTYDSPEKILGGSPYEKLAQDHDTVIALYDIPNEARFPAVNGFFSKDLKEVTEDPSGWIFMRGGDAVYIACRPLQPYIWKPLGPDKRLFSPYLKNGFVVQAAAASEYPDLQSFARAILELPLEVHLDPTPRVTFRSLRGTRMEFTFGQTPRFNGKPLDYDHWPLFGGPFMEAAVDSEKLTMKYEGMRRTLDFRNLTITDSVK
jgi:hypothetical protein